MKCTTCKDDGDLPQTADLQFSLEADDFVPERHFYHEVSYVTPADAYKMTLWNIFPEDHFRHEDSTYKLPKGFIVRNREEPYDFTRPIPSVKELDEELADYFAQKALPSTAAEGLDPMNCPLHSPEDDWPFLPRNWMTKETTPQKHHRAAVVCA